LVVFVIADLGCFDLKVVQKFACVARVFGCDEVCCLQNSDGAICHVFEIADRGSDNVKYSCVRIWLHFDNLEFLTADERGLTQI
jgi:hypothetical protein